MRNYQWIVSGILAASVCCGLTACKKTETTADKTETQQAIEQAPKAPKNWDKTEVNGLLAYVPSDTPFIMASTREFDVNSPVVKDFMARAGKLMTQMQSLQDTVKKFAQSDEDLKSLTDSFELGAQLLPLYADYQKNAPEFGLNPINSDSVMYMDGANAVFKLTVDDSAKLKAKLMPIIDLVIKILSEDGIEIAKEDTAARTVYTLKEKISRDDILGLPEEDRKDSPDTAMKLIVDYGADDVTAVLSFDAKAEIDIDRMLKPAANPLTKDKLGAIDETTAGLGYIDNAGAIKKMLAAPASRELLNEFFGFDLTAECASEISALVSDYPRLTFAQRFVGGKEYRLDSTLVFADKEELNNIKALQVGHQDISDDKTQFSFGINFDLLKTIGFIAAKANAAAAKEYKCASFKEFRDDLIDMTKTLQSPEFAQYSDSFLKITGINIGIHRLDLTKFGEGVVDFDGILNVSGNPIVNAAKLVASELSGDFGALLSLTANAEKPLELDLSKLLPGQKLNVYMTDANFMAASPSYDIMTLAKKAPKAEKTFAEITWNMDFYKQIVASAGNAMPEEKAMFESLAAMYDAFDGNFVSSVGTNAEGITFNSSYIMK